MNCAEEELVAFFATCPPIFCHFLVLQGELVKIFACPFAVKIDTCGETLESLFVQPFDALEKRANMCTRDGAQCYSAEFHELWNVLFDGLETTRIADCASGDIVMVFWPVERKVNAEFFTFAKAKKFIVEQRSVCVDRKLQLEIFRNFAIVHRVIDNRLCEFDTFINGVSSQKRLPPKERDV